MSRHLVKLYIQETKQLYNLELHRVLLVMYVVIRPINWFQSQNRTTTTELMLLLGKKIIVRRGRLEVIRFHVWWQKNRIKAIFQISNHHESITPECKACLRISNIGLISFLLSLFIDCLICKLNGTLTRLQMSVLFLRKDDWKGKKNHMILLSIYIFRTPTIYVSGFWAPSARRLRCRRASCTCPSG